MVVLEEEEEEEEGWSGLFHRWGTMVAAGVMRVLLLLIIGAADPRPPSVRVEIMVRFLWCFSSLLFR